MEFSSGREGTAALASHSHMEEVAFCSAKRIGILIWDENKSVV